MALMIGAMVMQGVTPGPNFITEKPQLFWGLIASMWIGNLMLLVLNLPLVGLWVRLLKIPYNVLFPGIIAFASIGAYGLNGSAVDLIATSAFGVLGYALIKLDCEPAPMLMGFILGPMVEEYLRRSMIMSHGDPTIFIQEPISAFLLVLAALMRIAVSRPSLANKREQAFQE